MKGIFASENGHLKSDNNVRRMYMISISGAFTQTEQFMEDRVAVPYEQQLKWIRTATPNQLQCCYWSSFILVKVSFEITKKIHRVLSAFFPYKFFYSNESNKSKGLNQFWRSAEKAVLCESEEGKKKGMLIGPLLFEWSRADLPQRCSEKNGNV